ncbi:MAG: hypothetical protein NTZ59_01925 [Bacteroidetes bacterium]|nr:hypothetical protein [Bacteroidota bacterium]
MLYELFYKYLILNGTASMPGIGTFGVEQMPATMDYENKKLNPPSQNIRLQSTEIATDIYSFYNYLASELNINESDAARRFQEFSHDIQKQLNASGSVLLPGIGIMKREVSGIYTMDSENDTKQVLPDLWITKTQAATTGLLDVYSTERPSIIKNSSVESDIDRITTVKESEDYWWVFAIIIAIMGLGALLYYYI